MLLNELVGYVGVTPVTKVKPDAELKLPLLVEIEIVFAPGTTLPNMSTMELAPSAGTDVDDTTYGTAVPYGPVPTESVAVPDPLTPLTNDVAVMVFVPTTVLVQVNVKLLDEGLHVVLPVPVTDVMFPATTVTLLPTQSVAVDEIV
jgi:hypothetical protein